MFFTLDEHMKIALFGPGRPGALLGSRGDVLGGQGRFRGAVEARGFCGEPGRPWGTWGTWQEELRNKVPSGLLATVFFTLDEHVKMQLFGPRRLGALLGSRGDVLGGQGRFRGAVEARGSCGEPGRPRGTWGTWQEEHRHQVPASLLPTVIFTLDEHVKIQLFGPRRLGALLGSRGDVLGGQGRFRGAVEARGSCGEPGRPWGTWRGLGSFGKP